MKKTLAKTGKILLSILCLVILLSAGLSAYHHAMLGAEQKKLVPPGQLYSVNGHSMHLYTTGANPSAPTIVLLSGSGTAAPVYDFKVLHTSLSPHFHVAVVERSGYGYSSISGAGRQVATVLEETRALLTLAGESGPYILMPHSIGGVEALYWAQTYPEEVLGIVGLDMTVPQAAGNIPVVPFSGPLLAAAGFIGLQRLPFLYPIEYVALSEYEMQQAKYLTWRNAFNQDVRNEIALTHENISQIDLQKVQTVPILAFVSNDAQSRQEHTEFAEHANCELVFLDAPHYIHQFESEAICAGTLAFANRLA